MCDEYKPTARDVDAAKIYMEQDKIKEECSRLEKDYPQNSSTVIDTEGLYKYYFKSPDEPGHLSWRSPICHQERRDLRARLVPHIQCHSESRPAKIRCLRRRLRDGRSPQLFAEEHWASRLFCAHSTFTKGPLYTDYHVVEYAPEKLMLPNAFIAAQQVLYKEKMLNDCLTLSVNQLLRHRFFV
jgi:hypothetical protein